MLSSRPICLILAVLVWGAVGALNGGCVSAYKKSVGSDTSQVFRRIYLTDFNTAWQSVRDSLQNSPIDIEVRDAGYLQTKWTDNTSEKNFTDSFAGADAYLKAQYRFRVTVAKGFYNGKPSIKVSVQKDQLVQRDVLEGWKPVETDSYDENTLLYRIGRIILIKTKLAQIEEERSKREMENSEF
ncbi:MAG: hypothetical protein A2070_11865 [Bdellovibrionales bacterium GWC1_52_8]|nr:MAG: hypothetical protein A2Z97_00530 [Bdellovibrionales bacterium GWB1_52_6]OFZ03251.1 MAG: hypothetical protein A2X97_10020 [Bdellovibrionales bacterium GWA1_52_35]OFZ43773.1 MAG: hypothetical protein A2070_11865 [Bdellovibrionales bacterium GWC1_52_8]HCM40564.1 hypothetical protein [Bdellovibrionales bacterium]